MSIVSFLGSPLHAYERSHLVEDEDAFSDWYTSCVAIHLDEQAGMRVDQDEFERVAYSSLEVWEDQMCTNLSLEIQGWSTTRYVGYNIEDMDENQNLILFQSEEDGWLYDPQVVGLTTLTMCQNETEGCLAGTIIDGDIELNEVYFNLTTTDEEIEVDLQNVLTHEVGHLIGFDHNLMDAESTMHAETPLGETKKRDLTSDDQQGVCDVYPVESTDDQLRLGCLYGPYVFGEISQRGIDELEEYEEDIEELAPLLGGCQATSGSSPIHMLWSLLFLLIGWIHVRTQSKVNLESFDN
jgi:ssRNA-specific RNase YbeY (16S rRNA maturation enzyme)